MANIRAKFTSGKRLESYSRKKYVWKMIYMFMLGYEVDFGHMEMINCLSDCFLNDLNVNKLFI